MKVFGIKRIPSDPHSFIVTKTVKGRQKILIVPVYVDDLFPFGDKELVDEFERYIPDYFETSTPCDAHYFLGIQVTRNRNPSNNVPPWISLDQITFADNTIAAIWNSFQTLGARTSVLGWYIISTL